VKPATGCASLALIMAPKTRGMTVNSQAPTSRNQNPGKLSRRLRFLYHSFKETLRHCIPSVWVPQHQKLLIIQKIFVCFAPPIFFMKILLLLKSLKQVFHKRPPVPPTSPSFPSFLQSEKTHPMGETRPWSRLGPGGLLGGPPPKRAHLATTRALCYKIHQPSKPSPMREARKRGGSDRMVAEVF
jgi:hypothetical protein